MKKIRAFNAFRIFQILKKFSGALLKFTKKKSENFSTRNQECIYRLEELKFTSLKFKTELGKKISKFSKNFPTILR